MDWLPAQANNMSPRASVKTLVTRKWEPKREENQKEKKMAVKIIETSEKPRMKNLSANFEYDY